MVCCTCACTCACACIYARALGCPEASQPGQTDRQPAYHPKLLHARLHHESTLLFVFYLLFLFSLYFIFILFFLLLIVMLHTATHVGNNNDQETHASGPSPNLPLLLFSFPQPGQREAKWGDAQVSAAEDERHAETDPL